MAGDCVFCAIIAGEAEVSMVLEDEKVAVWMDLNPVSRGHLLVVPRRHVAGLDDLDGRTGAHVWAVGREMARALRRSSLGCEGVNLVVCDGAAAFQTVFHFHLHVVPRHHGDGLGAPFAVETVECERSLLDADARTIRAAIEGQDVPPPR